MLYVIGECDYPQYVGIANMAALSGDEKLEARYVQMVFIGRTATERVLRILA